MYFVRQTVMWPSKMAACMSAKTRADCRRALEEARSDELLFMRVEAMVLNRPGIAGVLPAASAHRHSSTLKKMFNSRRRRRSG